MHDFVGLTSCRRSSGRAAADAAAAGAPDVLRLSPRGEHPGAIAETAFEASRVVVVGGGSAAVGEGAVFACCPWWRQPRRAADVSSRGEARLQGLWGKGRCFDSYVLDFRCVGFRGQDIVDVLCGLMILDSCAYHA